jgi:hypothetical protein
MKTLFNLSVLFSLFAIISSCKKDKSESYVDDYSPKLTEEIGVEYTGDYFPIETGYSWTWDGTEKIEGTMVISGGGEKYEEPLDETINGSASRYIGSPEEIELETGTFTLYPANDNDGTVRYFEKKSDAVYIRAISVNSSDPVEVKNPVFLRKPLVVGDKWETEPSVDMKKVLEKDSEFTGDIDLDMKCMLFVVGMEDKKWKGDNVETVRLDERAEATATMDINESGVEGSMSILMQLTCKLNFLKDIGLTHQQSDYSLTMNGSFKSEGQKGTLSIDMTSNGDYILDYYFIEGSSASLVNKPVIEKNASGKFVVNVSKNQAINKQFEKALAVAEVIKKVLR